MELVTKEHMAKAFKLLTNLYEVRFRSLEEQLKSITEQGEDNELH